MATFDERKRSADTLYETRQLSRKALQNKIAETMSFGKIKKDKEISIPKEENKIEDVPALKKTYKPPKKVKPTKERKSRKKQKEEDNEMQRWEL